MTTSPKHTFRLEPGKKTRFNAGAYDPDSATPRYRYEVLLPFEDLKYNFEADQFLMGREGAYLWVWEFHNKTTWPAFVSIFKDGVLVASRFSDPD